MAAIKSGESGPEKVDVQPKTTVLDPATFDPQSNLGRKPFVWQKCKGCGKETAVIKETEKCHDCTKKDDPNYKG